MLLLRPALPDPIMLGFFCQHYLVSGQCSGRPDLLLVSARYENEFKPIFAKMKWESDPFQFPSIKCAIGKLVVDAGRSLRVVYMCAGEMGLAAATALTSHAINVYRPRLIVALGMCCGFNVETGSSKSLFGDVLIAREAACWEEGKYEELANKKEASRTIGQRRLSQRLGMSRQTLSKILLGKLNSVDGRRISNVASSINAAVLLERFKIDALVRHSNKEVEGIGLSEFARILDIDASNLRKVLSRKRPLTARFTARLELYFESRVIMRKHRCAGHERNSQSD